MDLKTRIDGKSLTNNSFKIMSEEGEELAEITQTTSSGTTLNIKTKKGLYIQKPSGWASSKQD